MASPAPDSKKATPKPKDAQAKPKKTTGAKSKPKKAAKRRAKPRSDKGRMQLYDVTVVDPNTGEAIDQRRLDCSCKLFRSWLEGGLDDPYGGQYPDSSVILVTPH